MNNENTGRFKFYKNDEINHDVAKRIWDICKLSPDYGNAVMDIIGVDAYEEIMKMQKVNKEHNQDQYETLLEAWKKTQEELMAYAEEIASTYFYDSRVEATLHCLTVMRKNLEVAIDDKSKEWITTRKLESEEKNNDKNIDNNL
jgi:hypothetical protein